MANALPAVAGGDARLGSMLAALAVVISLAVRIMRPPAGLPQLRSLRSRLGFGLVGVPAARAEAETILLGPPRENYVASKAEGVISSLKESVRVCEDLSARMDRIISLEQALQAKAGDEKLIQAAAEELRGLFKRMTSDIKSEELHLTQAKRLRRDLDKRVEIARFMVDIPPAQLQAVLSRVDEALLQSNTARVQMARRGEQFFAAFKLLSETVKDHPAAKGQVLRLSEVLRAICSD